MKNLSILIIGIFILFSSVADAQCKFKNNKSLIKAAKTEDCVINPGISTKVKKILNKAMTAVALTSFSKSGDEYYLYFGILRNNSSKFDIQENNSLIFLFDDGEPVTVFPCGYFTHRALPLLDCQVACFYKITKEQIKQLADNGRVRSFILHVSADKEIPSAQIDEDGTMFFEYEINSENLATNLSHAAACILTK